MAFSTIKTSIEVNYS